jgi:hypothetical protein
VVLEEGVMRTRTRLDYAISRAELSTLTVNVPEGQRVTGVFDANVKRWNVTSDEQGQTIVVELYQPARGNQSLTIELERFFEQGIPDEVPIPVVQAVNVSRQQGMLVVRTGLELQIDSIRRTGLLQVDSAELPQTLQNGRWAHAFRFSALPYELVLQVSQIRPRIDADLLAECYLDRQQLTVEVLALLDIQQAGVFQLDFEMPAGYEVVTVASRAAVGAKVAAVDPSVAEKISYAAVERL